MPPQNHVDADTVKRVSDVIELLAKVAGSLGLLWAFLAKIWAPYRKRRDENLKRAIREALQGEIAVVESLNHPEEGWKSRIERIEKTLDRLSELALNNQDRHDETNGLLDALGFTSDRRSGEERRDIEQMVSALKERRHQRRRETDLH